MASFDTDAIAASRIFDVPFSGIRKVFDAVSALEAEGKDVIHWQIGRPDFDTPAHIKRAAAESLERGDVHYAPSMGIPRLRKAIAARTAIDTSIEVAWDTQVIVMAGANEGILCAMLAFINPGDEVIISNPNWHHYKCTAQLAGGVPVEVMTTEENDFALMADEVEKAITPKTKMLCITSPGNPTGTTIPESELKKLAALAQKHNLIVISDEIYARIFYGEGGCAPSIFSQPGMAERTIVINGFSKVYSMDGWRLGWTVASPELTRHILRVRQYTTVCVNTFIQNGAAHGLEADQGPIDEMIRAFAERRHVIAEGLRAIEGVTLAEPTGAFYAFPNLKAFGGSAEVAGYLLNEHAIATVGGHVFGAGGEGYTRIAYSCSTEECERGVERLGQALDQMRKAGA
ncbi:MAG: pyridoxal phosphate-dependent aminotransferase [bacterium]|nr:pyridoxal phosphate-dependent aminotransferase [bacterium]